MGVHRSVRSLGSTRGHRGQGRRQAWAFTLAAGDRRAEVWSYGAMLVMVEIADRDGQVVNVVRPRGPLQRCDDPEDRGGYEGAVVGRYANRIAGGRFRLDGRDHVLTRNDGPNHLHGGPIGFDQYVWEADRADDGRSVELRHVSPDGDEGYPGRLEVAVRYALDDESLTIHYEATTDAPTVVNLTNHAYWNLAGRGPIDDHQLRVDASHVLPVDGSTIPTGRIAPTVGTPFDLTSPRPLGPVVAAGGLDHYYVLDRSTGPAAELHHPPSGRSMTVETDQPGLQVYTANFLKPPHTAVCLETGIAPDAPNQPTLGSAVLRPGETYQHTTRHRFSCR